MNMTPIYLTLWLFAAVFPLSFASPLVSSPLVIRTDPFFPDQPSSCPICAQNYWNINSCAQAAPLLANFSMVMFNPGAFIDVIKCACTDTFQSVFPQCVDCFIKTNQSNVLNTPDLPSVISGMRQICGLGSAVLGNVSNVNGDTTPGAAPPPAPTGEAAGRYVVPLFVPFVVSLVFWTFSIL